MASPIETFILSPASAAVVTVVTGGLLMGKNSLIVMAIGALVGYFFMAHLGGTARPV